MTKTKVFEGTWRAAPAAIVLAALAACGGGGSSEPAPVVPVDNGGSTPSGEPIRQYMGGYVTACLPDSGATDAATNAALYSRTWYALDDMRSGTRANATMKVEFFSDSSCTGPVKSTVNLKGANTFLNIDGSLTLSNKTVHKVTFSYDPYFPGIVTGSGTIVINGVAFKGAPYTTQTVRAGKDLLLRDGKDLYTGDFAKPLDVAGYPTALATTKTASSVL